MLSFFRSCGLFTKKTSAATSTENVDTNYIIETLHYIQQELRECNDLLTKFKKIAGIIASKQTLDIRNELTNHKTTYDDLKQQHLSLLNSTNQENYTPQLQQIIDTANKAITKLKTELNKDIKYYQDFFNINDQAITEATRFIPIEKSSNQSTCGIIRVKPKKLSKFKKPFKPLNDIVEEKEETSKQQRDDSRISRISSIKKSFP